MNIKTIKKIIFLALLISVSISPNFIFAQTYENIPRALPVYEEDSNSQANPNNRSSKGSSFSLKGASSSFGSCAGSGAIANVVKNKIQSMIGSIGDTRVPTGNSVMEGKDTGTVVGVSWDQLGWCMVNSMIEAISAATVNWINSGFQGNPVFVDNPEQFFSDVADRQAGLFLNELSSGFLCSPIQDIVRINLANSYNSSISPYGNQAQCSFTSISGNLEQFMSGESFGWDDWMSYTQDSNNNPFGATINGQIELDQRIANSLGMQSTLLQWGGGFLSSTDPETGKITSPGSVIEKQVNERLFSGQRRLEVADEFDEVINALVDQLIKVAISEMTQR